MGVGSLLLLLGSGVARLESKHLYPLSHPASPNLSYSEGVSSPPQSYLCFYLRQMFQWFMGRVVPQFSIVWCQEDFLNVV